MIRANCAYAAALLMTLGIAAVLLRRNTPCAIAEPDSTPPRLRLVTSMREADNPLVNTTDRSMTREHG